MIASIFWSVSFRDTSLWYNRSVKFKFSVILTVGLIGYIFQAFLYAKSRRRQSLSWESFWDTLVSSLRLFLLLI